MKKVTIKLSTEDVGTVLRALDLAAAYYVQNKDALPAVDTWRPSERAMSAADMDMVKQDIVNQTASLRQSKPHTAG